MNQLGRELRVAPAVWLAILTLVGTALRVIDLGRWSLEGDEVFTYRDSVVPPQAGNARPLIYFLNYYLIRPWTELDELSLRVLPAVFGILAIPAIYLVVRRLLGQRAGLFAAFLLTFSALHVYHSQSARYWSLVFLLCLIYPAGIFIGIRERDRGWLAAGAITGLLAILAHPTAGLLFGGLGVWAGIAYSRHDLVRSAWDQRSVRWGAFGLAAATIAIALLFAPVLREWMEMPHQARLRGAALVLSYVDSLTVGLVLIGALGILWLWRNEERSLAFLLMSILLVPTLFWLVLSYFTAVSTAYLLPTTPAFFIGGAAFLDRLAANDHSLLPRGVLTLGVAALVISDNLPVLASHYLDGSRADFRAAARYVDVHRGAGDVVFSDQQPVTQHYLPGMVVRPMTRNPKSLEEALIEARQATPGAALWTVALVAPRGGFRTHSLPRVSTWIYKHCRLSATFGVPRLDFRQNELQIYRCPPEADDASESRVSNSR